MIGPISTTGHKGAAFSTPYTLNKFPPFSIVSFLQAFVRANVRFLLPMMLLAAKFLRGSKGTMAREAWEVRLGEQKEFQEGVNRQIPYHVATAAALQGLMEVAGLPDSALSFLQHTLKTRADNTALATGAEWQSRACLTQEPIGADLWREFTVLMRNRNELIKNESPLDGGADGALFDAHNVLMNGLSWLTRPHKITRTPTKFLAVHKDFIGMLPETAQLEATTLFKGNGDGTHRFTGLGVKRALYIPEVDVPDAIRNELTSIKGSESKKRNETRSNEPLQNKAARTTPSENSQAEASIAVTVPLA